MQTEGHAELLRDQLRHVYWIGGGSGAGNRQSLVALQPSTIYSCTSPTT